MGQPRPTAAIAVVRRKAALLAAASIVLAALGLEGYLRGYPLGMSMLAAATAQAGICCTLFRSRLLLGVAALNFTLLLFHSVVIGPHLSGGQAEPVFWLGDFSSAVFAAASLVFTPIETVALIVRQAYLKQARRREPP